MMTAAAANPPAASRQQAFVVDYLVSQETRLLMAANRQPDVTPVHQAEACRLAAAHLHKEGALLFRGLSGLGLKGFREFVGGFGYELLPYDFASTPRSQIASGIYSSTEYPAHQWIPQHNEQSYTRRWPLKIWFYCNVASPTGGQTPLADSRTIYRRVDRSIRDRFARRGLMYVRNYGGGLDLPWQTVFQTTERGVVEAFCREQEIAWEWLEGNRLRTRQTCQATARHPATGEWVWFNQAHLFHVSGLEDRVRQALLAVVDEEDLPRNVYYGDGAPIESSALDQIRGLYREQMLNFDWQIGDLLMLDNMLMTHGRAPFEGSRQVVVAMAEPWALAEADGPWLSNS